MLIQNRYSHSMILLLWFAFGTLFAANFSSGEETATLPEEIQVADGFRVELLYSVPLAEQGSWICMASDDQGRIICSDENGGLYRVRLSDNANAERGSAVHVEALPIAIGQAQGLLYAYDSLYVTVNGDAAQGPGFYRVRDTNEDDQFDEVTLLKRFDMGKSTAEFRDIKSRVQEFMIRRGHGPHGVCLGPDGMLYVIGGNHTKVPEGVDLHSPYQNWGEDLLLPRIEDAQGIGTGVEAPGGWVLRTDRDGSHWTLLCGGLRNGYDLAFNPAGDLFTFDADMEFDSGTPWYRPCRINHLVSGGEYGWRYGSGKWPEYFADSVGAVVNVGLASPTGVAFGSGAKFPPRYQRALFVGDWAYGKIFAVQLTPSGSSYQGTYEVFLQGKPLAVVDLLIHTDGAMYFLIGGRHTQSGLYRVTHDEGDAAPLATQQSAAPSIEPRELRRELESLHVTRGGVNESPEAISIAWPHLNSQDRHVRFAARVAIEKQPIARWLSLAKSEQRINASIQIAIAIARSGDSTQRGLALEKLRGLPLEILSEEQLLDALRAYALTFARLGGKNDSVRDEVGELLLPLLPSQSHWVNREICRLLIFLEHPDIVEPAMQILMASTTQEDQLFFLFVLRNMRQGWTIEQRQQYFGLLRRAFVNYEGGTSFQGFVRKILQDAATTLSEDEKQAVGAIIGGRETVAAVAQLKTPRQFVQNWQLSQLVPLLEQATQGRSFEQGEEAYRVARCDACHRFQGKGAATGPDLTGVGNRFSALYILEAILEPSKVIADEYRSWNLLTVDGEVLSGRIVREDDAHIVIRTHPFSPETLSVSKDQIESRSVSQVSEMPLGQISSLSKEEILDLISYLRSGGDATDPAFQAVAPDETSSP